MGGAWKATFRIVNRQTQHGKSEIRWISIFELLGAYHRPGTSSAEETGALAVALLWPEAKAVEALDVSGGGRIDDLKDRVGGKDGSERCPMREIGAGFQGVVS